MSCFNSFVITNLMDVFVDLNIDTSSVATSSTIFCYNNDICTEGEVDQGVIDDFNDCCGDNVFAPYYRIENGPCSPCKSISSNQLYNTCV